MKKKTTTPKTDKPKAPKKVREMSATELKQYVNELSGNPEYAFLKKQKKSSIKTDASRPAKPKGWRFKGDNYKKPSKKKIAEGGDDIYFESRAIRSDVSSKEQLAKGGTMSSFLSKAKSLGKKGLAGAKKLGEKGVEKAKEVAHEQKRKMAMNVINETKSKVGGDGKAILGKASSLVKNQFAKGGSVKNIEYKDIYNVLQNSIDGIMDEMPYENASTFTGKEVEHKYRSGFIPYTDGGYEAIWWEYVGMLNGSGKSLPTKPLEDEMQRQVTYQYDYAKDRFKEEYPEIVEAVGEDNVDYHSLYEAGYGHEAEKLSEWEMDSDGDDTIMMRVMAYYYKPESSRSKDGKHTISLFGDVNLESPYHRTGNLDDSHEITFTFNSIEELKKKMEDGLKEVVKWFNGDFYTKSKKKKLEITRMAEGGSIHKRSIKRDNRYKAIASGVRKSKKYATITMKDGSKFRRRNANQYYPDGVEGGIRYSEKRANHSDKYARGGDVSGKKYLLLSYSVEVSDDSNDEGINNYVNSWEENVGKLYNSKQELIKAMNDLMHTSYDESDFNWEIGEGTGIQTDVLVDDNNLPASQNQRIRWTEGKEKLYNANYWFKVYPVTIHDEYQDGGMMTSDSYAKGGDIGSSMNHWDSYGVFCIAVAILKDRNDELDLVWEDAISLYKQFLNSPYNSSEQSELDGINEFLWSDYYASFMNSKNNNNSDSYARGGAVRTNSKSVREAVRKHILESVYDKNEEQFGTFADASDYLASEFKRVADHPYNKQRYPNNQDRFQDYLRGIPFHFADADYKIEEFLNSLGINPEGKEYSSDKMWKLYSYLIWREISDSYYNN